MPPCTMGTLTMTPSHYSRGFTLSLFVAALLACTVRHDEFDCENAVSHLSECCPGFIASSIDCTYAPGCEPVYPELDVAQSDCIRGERCEVLRSTGVCDRAMGLHQPRGSASSGANVAVCPGLGRGSPPSLAVPDAAPDGTGAVGTIACTSASKCAPGEVCCAIFGPLATQCEVAPCSTGIQLCTTSSECGAGNICVQASTSIALLICRSDTDASFDARHSDVLDDVSPRNDHAAQDEGDASDAAGETSAELGAAAADASNVPATDAGGE
jgi:hypothetical protein